MFRQMSVNSKRNLTVGALEWSRIISSRSAKSHIHIYFIEVRNRPLMLLEMTFSSKANGTRITPKGSLEIVNIYVKSQLRWFRELFVTNRTN